MTTLILPNTIDVGTQKSAAEIQSNFDQVSSWANGNVDETNVPNLTAAFTTYKTFISVLGVVGSGGGVGANAYFMGSDVPSNNLATGGTNTGRHAFWFDPADFTANARTTRVRLRGLVLPNAVAPAVNFTFEMRPVTSTGGTAGAEPTIATVGAPVASVAVAGPAASTAAQAASVDAAAPSAGLYVLCASTSATTVANSINVIRAQLQIRQV